jgi:hypothetical protein
MSAPPSSALVDHRKASLLAAGCASIIGVPNPFERRKRVLRDVPAGASLEDALALAGMTLPYEGCGLICILNGRAVNPSLWSSTTVKAGDRIRAFNIPDEPASIFLFFVGLIEVITGVAVGTTFAGAVASIGLGGALAVWGTAAILTVATYVGGSYLLNLAINAIVGSPDQGNAVQQSTRSPTALRVGNRVQQDAPVWVVFGTARFNLPHAAIPLATHESQKPSQRMLLYGCSGNGVIEDLRMGNTPIDRMRPVIAYVTNQQTVNFPTIEQVRPGYLIEDNWKPTPSDWFGFALETECDEIVLDLELPKGLQRQFTDSGSPRQRGHALNLRIEFKKIADLTWLGFVDAATFTSGHGVAMTRVDGSVVRIATEVISDGLMKKKRERKQLDTDERKGTTEQTFLKARRKVPSRGVYEVRMRAELAAGIEEKSYTKDRRAAEDEPDAEGLGSTTALLTDVRWDSLIGVRDEPAIKDYLPGFTGVDLEITGESLNSDQGDRINALVSPYRPILVGGTRGAAQKTSNNSACALDVLTGVLAGVDATADAEIDFDSFQDFYDYCAEQVPALDGTLEARHECDGVMDIDQKSIWDVANDVIASARGKLDKVDGKWRVIIDRKQLAPAHVLSDADVIGFRTKIQWTNVPDALRCEFFNKEKDGQRDERMVYNDGFARLTASETGVAVSISRSGNIATITRSSGTWQSFPNEGWFKVTLPALFAGTKMFVIVDNPFGAAIQVVDVDNVLTSGHASTGDFATTRAERIELRRFPLTQRPSEIWRNGRHLLAQKARRAIHEIEVDWDWMMVTRGDMIEVSTDVLKIGKGRGRALAIQGTAAAITAIRLDDVYDLTGAVTPGCRIRTRSPSGLTVTQKQIDIAATNTLRSSTSDDSWIAFTSALNGTAINLKLGSAEGALVTWGEVGAITREVVVNRIRKGNDLTAVLVCHDHAPELFDDVDVKPIPIFYSAVGSDEGMVEQMAPPMPQLPWTDETFGSALCQINAGAPGTFNAQGFTRQDGGSFIEEGIAAGMFATVQGFTSAGNNPAHGAIQSVTDDVVVILPNASGSAEVGDGNERIIAGRRTGLATIGVDAAGTGLNAVAVAPQGGGVVYLDGPVGKAIFARFRAAGFVSCGPGFLKANSGVFPITALRNGGDGITITNANAVTESGSGVQFVEQTQFYATSGGNFSARFVKGDRVRGLGFVEPAHADAHFSIRELSTNACFVDDPGLLLRTEAPASGRHLRAVQARVSYRVLRGEDGSYEQYAVLRPSPGKGLGSRTDEYECQWRPVSEVTGLPVHEEWNTVTRVSAEAGDILIGPLDVDEDFEVRVRAYNRKNGTVSPWNGMGGSGLRGRPSAPQNLKITPDSQATVEGSVVVLRVSWEPVELQLITPTLVRYAIEGQEPVDLLLPAGQKSLSIYPAPFGRWSVEVRQTGESGVAGASAEALFDFEPDVGFHLARVLDVAILDDEGLASQSWTSADLRVRFREPSLTYQTGIGEAPGGLQGADGELDPMVRGFVIEAFDPDTGTLLRAWPEQRARDFLYSTDMMFVDQQKVFSRGLYPKVGLRIWMMSRTGLRSGLVTFIAVHESEPGIPRGNMQDHVGGDPFEAQIANLTVFDGNGTDVDTWVTVVSKSVVVVGQPGGLPSLVGYGGIFSALIEEGGDKVDPVSFYFTAQPLKLEYRIVVNPGVGEIEVVRPGTVDLSANGYIVGGHGGNLDLRYAGTYTYALQLRWTRDGYREGLARAGGLVSGNRQVLGSGTRWSNFIRPGDEIQSNSMHATNYYPILQVVSDTEILLEGNPDTGEPAFMPYKTRSGTDPAQVQEPNLRLLIKKATITVKEDVLAGT